MKNQNPTPPKTILTIVTEVREDGTVTMLPFELPFNKIPAVIDVFLQQTLHLNLKLGEMVAIAAAKESQNA